MIKVVIRGDHEESGVDLEGDGVVIRGDHEERKVWCGTGRG